MEQSHSILINRFFTAITQTFGESDLKNVNSYYLTQEGSANKIVDEYNVRGFLNHEKNQNIVTGFFAYLTGNPTMNEAFYSSNGTQFKASAEFKEIYYNDEKLATSFNDYYNSSVVRGKAPRMSPSSTPKFVENQLLNLTGQDFEYSTFNQSPNYFMWNSTAVMNLKYLDYIPLDFNSYSRNNFTENVIVKKPVGDNYLISVFLQRTISQTSREIFEICDEKIIKSIADGNVGFFGQIPVGTQNDIFSTLPSLSQYNSIDSAGVATNLNDINSGIIPFNINTDLDLVEVASESSLRMATANNNQTNSSDAERSQHEQISTLLKNLDDSSFNLYRRLTSFDDLLRIELGKNDSSAGVTLKSTLEETQTSGTTSATSLIQCFVDLNLKTDENEFYVSKIPKISFEYSAITVYEGAEYLVKLILTEPCIGNESITILWTFYPNSIQTSDFQYGVPVNFKQTYYFSAGEQYKILDPAKIKLDIFKFNPRMFRMSLVDHFNLSNGLYPFMDVTCIDTTNWKNISFQPTGEEEYVNGVPYVLHDDFAYNGEEYAIGEFAQPLIDAGIFFTVNIILDEPSQYGIENFSLSFDRGTTFEEAEGSSDWQVWWWMYSSPVQTNSGQLSGTSLPTGDVGPGGHYWSNMSAFEQIPFQQGEQVKTLIFQFLPNEDLNTGSTEYFDIKITNLNFVEEGQYLNTRIYIQDYTIGEPAPGTTSDPNLEGEFAFCLIPDYYYTDLGPNEVDQTIGNALIFTHPSLSPMNKLRLGTPGPRFRDYFRVSDNSGWYLDDNDWIDNDRLVYDLKGNEWQYGGITDNSGSNVPAGSFWLVDTCSIGSPVANTVFWTPTNNPQTICGCLMEMYGVSENDANNQAPSGVYLEDGTYFSNGTLINGGAIQSLNDIDSTTGLPLIGPPRDQAVPGPRFNVVTNPLTGVDELQADYQASVADGLQIEGQVVDAFGCINCDVSLNYADSDGNHVFDRSPGFRFLLKAAKVTVPRSKLSSALTELNAYENIDLAVFYLGAGLRKSWQTDGGNLNLVWFPLTIQKTRRVDSCGDVWEWCYRFTSIIPPDGLTLSIMDPRYLNSGPPYNGWGWYKMMNLITGEAYVQADQVIDAQGIEKDGVPFSMQSTFLTNYPTTCPVDFTTSPCHAAFITEDTDNNENGEIPNIPESITIELTTDYFDSIGALPITSPTTFWKVFINGGVGTDIKIQDNTPYPLTVPKNASVEIVATYNPYFCDNYGCYWNGQYPCNITTTIGIGNSSLGTTSPWNYGGSSSSQDMWMTLTINDVGESNGIVKSIYWNCY